MSKNVIYFISIPMYILVSGLLDGNCLYAYNSDLKTESETMDRAKKHSTENDLSDLLLKIESDNYSESTKEKLLSDYGYQKLFDDLLASQIEISEPILLTLWQSFSKQYKLGNVKEFSGPITFFTINFSSLYEGLNRIHSSQLEAEGMHRLKAALIIKKKLRDDFKNLFLEDFDSFLMALVEMIQYPKQIDKIRNIIDDSFDQKLKEYQPQDKLKRTMNKHDFFSENKKEMIIELISEPFYNELEKKINAPTKIDPELIKFYKNDIKNFSEMIYSNLPEDELEKNLARSGYTLDATTYGNVLSKVIYNLDGYTKDENGNTDIYGLPPTGGNVEIGKPLVLKAGETILDTLSYQNTIRLNKDLPIGYNLHLPIISPGNPIKGVMVIIYGGYPASYRKQHLYRPKRGLGNLGKYLLKQNIAVVTLNLPDFLELHTNQNFMDKELNSKIHACINEFFKNIRNKKTNGIFNGLIPEKTKIYLYGASFGGAMVTRHAELYPETFDGYISHDGAVSFDMWRLSDLPGTGREFFQSSNEKRMMINQTKQWLSPVDEESKAIDSKVMRIQRPILLLHNFDDNNVNVKVSLDFYKKAQRANKDVQLLITRRGNPIPQYPITTNKLFSKLKERETDKGHFVTEEEEAFKSYGETIAKFILEGLSKFTTANRWMAHQYEIYANKNYKAATLEERFISEAYRLYKSPYRILDRMRSNNAKATNDEKPYSYTYTVFNQDWVNVFADLYQFLAYLEYLKKDINAIQAEINSIKNNGMLTNIMIENALLQQLPLFLEYLREQHNYTLENDLDLMTLAKDKSLQSIFRDLLLNGSVNQDNLNFKAYLLYSLYMGNPAIIKSKISNLIRNRSQWSEVVKFLEPADMLEARNNLFLRIEEDLGYFKETVREEMLAPGKFGEL